MNPPAPPTHQQQQQQPQSQSQSQSQPPKTRPSASCIPCRNRKVKCNRTHPCTTCLTRNTPHECAYSASEADREAMRQADVIASLRRRVRGLRGAVGEEVGVGGTGGAYADADGFYEFGGKGSGEFDEDRAMEAIYAALRDGEDGTVEGVVGLLRGGVGVKEIAGFIRQSERMVVQ